MTEKENYLAVLRGEQPEWVPNFSEACSLLMPSFSIGHMMTEEKIDFYGVAWVLDDYGPMPAPNRKLMTDISEWKSWVKFPDLDAIDWEKMAAEDLKNFDPNKAVNYMSGGLGGVIFIPLMNMMGFENGLCAIFEEPETVAEFFDYAITFHEESIRRVVKYYKPDVIMLGDDVATAQNMMISAETYRTLLKPFYKRICDLIKSYGLPVEFHVCGKCEAIIEDLVEIGVNVWQPAQPLNDLKAIKKKYGNKLILNGTWFTQGAGGTPGASEETVRMSVRESIDAYARGGGFVFWDGNPVGTSQDMIQKMAWVKDETLKYGKYFYKKKDMTFC